MKSKAKKFPKPRAKWLDLKEIKSFLYQINFETESISQEWRHVVAFGKYKNKASIFKLASTKKTSPNTANEYAWNEIVNNYAKSQRLSFQVPQNYSHGNYQEGLFYLICERFFGETLEKTKSYPLEKIAKTAYEIILMPEPKTKPPQLKTKNKNIPIKERLLASSVEWASQSSVDLKEFIEVIDNSEVKTAPAHGDFTVRAMFNLKNRKIGLIDGEHFGLKGPKYYDPAWFYLRLRVEQNDLNFAKEFLKIFKNLLSEEEKKNFWEELKPVLTQRLIGHFWGAKNNLEETKKLQIIGEEILANKII